MPSTAFATYTIEQDPLPRGPFNCGEKKVCLQDLLSSLSISMLIEYFRLENKVTVSLSGVHPIAIACVFPIYKFKV